MTTLHITNGDSAAQGMAASGLTGTILPWRDILHDGPVPPDFNRRAFRAVRAEFLSRQGWASVESAQSDMSDRDELVDAIVDGDTVVLWFEPDLYDQLQLAQVLSRFAERDVALRPSMFIVPADNMLGTLEPGEFLPLLATKRALRDADLMLGARAWSAITGADPDALVAMAREPQPASRMRNYASNPEVRLPYLNSALRRLLEEYPARSGGLSRTELQLCEVLAGGEHTLGDCYAAAHHSQEEWVWLGDWSFAWYVERVSHCPRPIVLRTDGDRIAPIYRERDSRGFWSQSVQLTSFGRDVLEGRADHVQANGIDRWIGSVHLTEGRCWRWDPRAQRLIAQ